MSENVHYNSWPLDRDFTFNEWCDYLRERDKRGEGTSEVVAEILGDAQPAPVLRMELQELIDKIKEESK